MNTHNKSSSIYSKKFFKSSQIQNILENNDLVIFLNYGGFDSQESLLFKKFIKKYNLKLVNVKNKPLINLLSETKYSSISPVFQGNSCIIYQDKGLCKNNQSNSLVNLITEKEFNKVFFSNDKIIPMGFLLYNTNFLTPALFQSLLNRSYDISGFTTLSILQNSSRNILNNAFQKPLYNLIHKIDFIK